MILISAIATPRWLIGFDQTKVDGNDTIHYRNSIGIYNKCDLRKNLASERFRYSEQCIIYAYNFSKIASPAWKACIVFLAVGVALHGVSSLLAACSLCKQIVKQKSLLTVAGAIQGIAGLFLVLALVLYPAGWKDNSKVERLCYKETPYMGTKAFKIGDCTMGVAFYFAIAGTLGSFFCSLCAIVADRSVFSSKVQDEILEGKKLICLP